jgi:hypothetical protein
VKGTYRQPKPQNTKAKGGNPSYFKPDYTVSSPCTNMKGEVIESGGKYFAKDGKVRKKRQNTGTHYVRRIAKQVIKLDNDQIIYGTVSLLQTGGGKQFWVARQEVEEWDSEQCVARDVLVGESISVIKLECAEGCWQQIEKQEICDTVKPTKNSALNRLAGVL